jgi:hypothetical protein
MGDVKRYAPTESTLIQTEEEKRQQIAWVKEKVTLRDYIHASDEGLVFESWLRGLYFGNDWFHAMKFHRFNTNYHKIIEYILTRSVVNIACLREDPDVTLGYSVVDEDILHWVFIKSSWRRFGIARKLIPVGINTVTHLTRLGKQLKPRHWEFNPFYGQSET